MKVFGDNPHLVGRSFTGKLFGFSVVENEEILFKKSLFQKHFPQRVFSAGGRR